MESFIVAGEDKPVFTPEIIMDSSTGKCHVKGESYLEEPFQLYDSVLSWIQEFTQKEQKPLDIDVELTYINSTSSRAVLDLFRGIASLIEEGREIQVKWRYPEGDDDFNEIKEEGEEFMEESGLHLELVSY